jgi:hypothetical protein
MATLFVLSKRSVIFNFKKKSLPHKFTEYFVHIAAKNLEDSRSVPGIVILLQQVLC